MVQITPFAVTQWFDLHAHDAKYNMAATASATLSIQDLLDLSEDRKTTEQALSFNAINLDYNHPMRGGQALRENLAALYSARAQGVTPEDILIANAAIDANHIVLATLVGPSDHVICHYPTYEQLYQVPRSLGAEVSLWKTDPSSKWQLNMDELKAMIKDNTKMIIVNNPHNPSGAIIPKPQLEEIVELAEEKGIIIMSDEVFRPMFHSVLPSDDDFPPSMVNLGYKKTVVTGSMSKAYGLPGIRVGWIASRDQEIIAACHKMRYYTTTCVSQLDEAVAAEALSDRCIHAILAKNIASSQANVELWQNFIDEHNWGCTWVRPRAGTTAMVKFHKMGKPVDDEKLALMLQDKTDICVIPGSVCFGDREHFKGHVRIGLAIKTEEVKAGLAALRKFMEEEFEHVPLAPK
jgi:aspartate/methionine/tyrosine aminotransferase